MRLRRRLAALAAVLMAPLGLLLISTAPANATTVNVCFGQSWGFGWFETNTFTDFTRCGSFQNDMIQLTSWYDMPLNSTMTVCAAQSGGPGISLGEWTILGQFTNFAACGSGANNMLTVGRTALGNPVINLGGVVSDAPDHGFHSGSQVTIWGVDFYPSDTVSVVSEISGQGGDATLSFDDVIPTLNGQINAQLPNLPVGTADVYVINRAGLRSTSPYRIFIS